MKSAFSNTKYLQCVWNPNLKSEQKWLDSDIAKKCLKFERFGNCTIIECLKSILRSLDFRLLLYTTVNVWNQDIFVSQFQTEKNVRNRDKSVPILDTPLS